MAHQRERDLNEIVAGARLIEKRAEEDEEEDERGRNAQRDAEDALRSDPLVVHNLGERVALMRDDRRHVGAEEGVGEKDGSDDHQRRTKRAARRLQKDHDADGGDDEVLRDWRADAAGDVSVEDENIESGRRPEDSQRPFPGRDAVLGGAEQDCADDACADNGNPPGRSPFLGADHEERGQQRRHNDREAKLNRRARGGIGREGEEQSESEVERPRLGVVEDAEADHEGDRRGDPELEQRPCESDDQDQFACKARRRSPACVGGGDEFIQLRLAEAAFARSGVFNASGLSLIRAHP